MQGYEGGELSMDSACRDILLQISSVSDSEVSVEEITSFVIPNRS